MPVQARELNISGAGVQIVDGQERRVVTWPEVIGDITGLVEHGLVGGADLQHEWMSGFFVATKAARAYGRRLRPASRLPSASGVPA